jgi:hypothetical protein
MGEWRILSQGYWMMPNIVLFSSELTDKQKLLFCLISSLCAEKWFCRATNDYLWKLLWASKTTISKNISALQEKWFVSVDVSLEQWNSRKITIVENDYPMVENDKRYSQKWQEGYSQKWQHNNTTTNTTTEKKENLKRKFLEFVFLTDEEYNKLIEQYGNRVITEQIENLNNYIWQNGKDKYKSHYYTLLNWLKKAWIKKQQTKQQNEYEISEWVYDIDKLLNNLPS